MVCQVLVQTSTMSSWETGENHSVNPSSYIGGILQEITHVVKDSITYSRANEQIPGGTQGTGMTSV